MGVNFFRGVFGLSFQPNLLLNMLRTLTFFMKICWKKLSPKNRKFRFSRQSETRRKLDSVKCVVWLDSNFLGWFWTLSFSGESAAEYAGNSGL